MDYFPESDTGFMDGAERIAKLMDFPVFYCELKKQRRDIAGWSST